MTTTALKRFKEIYKDQIDVWADTLDERHNKGGQDWESFIVGWAMGKGLNVNDAYEFYKAIETII